MAQKYFPEGPSNINNLLQLSALQTQARLQPSFLDKALAVAGAGMSQYLQYRRGMKALELQRQELERQKELSRQQFIIREGLQPLTSDKEAEVAQNKYPIFEYEGQKYYKPTSERPSRYTRVIEDEESPTGYSEVVYWVNPYGQGGPPVIEKLRDVPEEEAKSRMRMQENEGYHFVSGETTTGESLGIYFSRDPGRPPRVVPAPQGVSFKGDLEKEYKNYYDLYNKVFYDSNLQIYRNKKYPMTRKEYFNIDPRARQLLLNGLEQKAQQQDNIINLQ